MDADAHVALVRAAADAHFNTLRIWGGVRAQKSLVVDTQCDTHLDAADTAQRHGWDRSERVAAACGSARLLKRRRCVRAQGVFMPQLFYEAADMMGLLIYHVRTTMRQQQARLARGDCETLMTRRHSPCWEAVV